MLKYFGILDGDNMSPGDILNPHHVLQFDTLQEAEWTLREARTYSAPLRTDLFGQYPGDIPGGVGDDGRLTLYSAPIAREDETITAVELWRMITDNGDPYPDFVLTFGPRGGVKRESV